MDAPRRYRITVTPVEPDGLPCFHRCSLEFDHTNAEDLMRRVEAATTLHTLAGDEATALVIGLSLLGSLSVHGTPESRRLLAPLSSALRTQSEQTWKSGRTQLLDPTVPR
jgi:hypothetical protein